MQGYGEIIVMGVSYAATHFQWGQITSSRKFEVQRYTNNGCKVIWLESTFKEKWSVLGQLG